MSLWKEFRAGGVVIDDRYLPAIVTTFFGEVSLEAATWHGEQHRALVEAQARRGARIITITDSSHTKPPPAEVRKYWADYTKGLPPPIKEATLAAFVVITNPIIRGVMTALSWLNPELRTVELYDTVEVALRVANERLTAARQSAPPSVNRYYLPPEARAALAKWVV